MFSQIFSSVTSKFRYKPLFQTNSKGFNEIFFHVKQLYSTVRPRSYYAVLGVDPKASDQEVKEAYYKLSKRYHPDLNIGNKMAESKILEINAAFEVLGNKVEKEKYDNKMFPKVWEKNSFIYDHDEKSETQNFIFRRTFKFMPSSYDQFVRHSKGEAKRKRRHGTQKYCFNKSESSKTTSNVFIKF